jgi:hypothetical protein
MTNTPKPDVEGGIFEFEPVDLTPAKPATNARKTHAQEAHERRQYIKEHPEEANSMAADRRPGMK